MAFVMNVKRIIFWASFLVILALIVWGLAVAMNRPQRAGGAVAGSLAPAPVSAEDHVQGSPDALVTLIEYSDFQCPACQSYYWSISKLLQEEPATTLRFVYRNFPLPQHANAIPSSMAVEAAGLQGKYWPMFDLIFQNHTDWTELADATPVFIGYAKEIGLDVAKFTLDLKNQALADHVQTDIESGRTAGINSTPTFFINGKAITNPKTYADFKKLIDEAASQSAR